MPTGAINADVVFPPRTHVRHTSRHVIVELADVDVSDTRADVDQETRPRLSKIPQVSFTATKMLFVKDADSNVRRLPISDRTSGRKSIFRIARLGRVVMPVPVKDAVMS